MSLNGNDVKKQFKSLILSDIQQSTDSASFSKGQSYYRNDYIFDAIIRGASLKASCQGSSGGPYLVTATLLPISDKSQDKLKDWGCNCPRGGFCKHIVALLLTWLEQPEQFEVRQPFEDMLKSKSREELLYLIQELAKRQPEVESELDFLLNLPVPGAKSSVQVQPVDVNSIRRKVSGIIANMGYEWNAASNVADALGKFNDMAAKYAEARQWLNALQIYTVVIEELLDSYEEMNDEESDVFEIMNECIEALSEILNKQPGLPQAEKLSAVHRIELLQTLFNCWLWDGNFGDFDTNIDSVIIGNINAEERKIVEEWTRQEMQERNENKKNRLVRFLIQLKQASGLSDEELLQEYRQAGLHHQLIEKLLEFNRIDEAIKLVAEKEADISDTLSLVNLILQKGAERYNKPLLALVEAKLAAVEKQNKAQKTSDFAIIRTIDSYRSWLTEKYKAFGMPEKAFNLELIRFQASPTEANYRAARIAAQMPGQPREIWSTLRPRLLTTLEQKANWYALLNIYLEENEVGKALALLNQLKPDQISRVYNLTYSESYEIKVAAAAEKDYPEEAIRLYREVAEKLIEARNRSSYIQAVEYLGRIKRLYEKQNKQPEWEKYLAHLRGTYKTLKAFQEELGKAKL